MTTKHTPATPLPFRDFITRMDNAAVKSEYRSATHDLAGFVQGHHEEIEKRWNAYPRLVAALDALLAECANQGGYKGQAEHAADALLAELGEGL